MTTHTGGSFTSLFHRALIALPLAVGLLFLSPALAEPVFLLQGIQPYVHRTDTDDLSTTFVVGFIDFNVENDIIELINAPEGKLYTVDRDTNTLITISTEDASILDTVLLDVDASRHPRGYDISPEGILYGILPDLTLRTIDPSTGETTVVTPLSGAYMVEAIAFAPDGTLYASGSPDSTMGTHLYTIDIESGLMSLVGVIGLEIDTLRYLSDDYLYGARSGLDRRTLYRINPATAALEVVGDTGVNSITGIAPVIVPTEVEIDVQPRINLRVGNQLITVAVLTTDDFDATQVNLDTVTFGPDYAWAVGDEPVIEDVDGDGDYDQVFRFLTRETGIECGDREASLSGETFAGQRIRGTDTFRTIGCQAEPNC